LHPIRQLLKLCLLADIHPPKYADPVFQELLVSSNLRFKGSTLLSTTFGFIQPPSIGVGITVTGQNGATEREEEAEVRSAALASWQPSNSLAQIAAEIVMSAESPSSTQPASSMFDEYGQIRQVAS